MRSHRSPRAGWRSSAAPAAACEPAPTATPAAGRPLSRPAGRGVPPARACPHRLAEIRGCVEQSPLAEISLMCDLSGVSLTFCRRLDLLFGFRYGIVSVVCARAVCVVYMCVQERVAKRLCENSVCGIYCLQTGPSLGVSLARRETTDRPTPTTRSRTTPFSQNPVPPDARCRWSRVSRSALCEKSEKTIAVPCTTLRLQEPRERRPFPPSSLHSISLFIKHLSLPD